MWDVFSYTAISAGLIIAAPRARPRGEAPRAVHKVLLRLLHLLDQPCLSRLVDARITPRYSCGIGVSCFVGLVGVMSQGRVWSVFFSLWDVYFKTW